MYKFLPVSAEDSVTATTLRSDPFVIREEKGTIRRTFFKSDRRTWPALFHYILRPRRPRPVGTENWFPATLGASKTGKLDRPNGVLSKM